MTLPPTTPGPLVMAAFLFLAGLAPALTESDAFYNQQTSAYPDSQAGGWFLNLGITGARGRMSTDWPTEIEVAYIFNGTPAKGELQVGDRIVGANGSPFTTPHKFGYGMDKFGYEGPLMDLGNAIDASQGPGLAGQLVLDIVRGGSSTTATLNLPTNYGSFSATYPFNCPKSDLILPELYDYLASRQQPNGSWTGGRPHVDAFAALALLASGDASYQPNVLAAMQYFAAQTNAVIDYGGLDCWKYGLYGICLAEYYLATGEAWVLPELEEINSWLTQAQFAQAYRNGNGAGGWGHRPSNRPGGNGYGPICMITAQAMTAWALMEHCGIAVDAQRYALAHDFLVRGTNNIGYAWYADSSGGDNAYADMGRTGASVVAHAVSPTGDPAYAQYTALSTQCIGTNPDTFPDTHGSPILGIGWTALGASFDDTAFRQLMDEHVWHFTLAHNPDGTFYYQPNRDNNAQDFSSVPRLSASAAAALVLSIKNRSLHVTGAPFRSPYGLSASAGPGGVTLAWELGTEVPSSVRVLRNGVELAAAAPAVPATFLDTTAQPGTIDYRLEFTMPGDPAPDLTTTLDGGITGLELSPTPGSFVLTWTNNMAYDGIEIRRNGTLLEAALAGSATTYTDTSPPASGAVTYAVAPTNGSSAPAEVQINLSLAGELGVLNPVSANGGINPATGLAWADGDTYRLVFVTSANTTCDSTDIAAYNTFVQGLANAAGLGAATWNVVGSTATVDARDNTNTNPDPGEDGIGEPVFRMDGTFVIANDYADLWDGINVAHVDGEIWLGVHLDEYRNERLHERVRTGSDGDGTASTDQARVLGGSAEFPSAKVTTGRNYAPSHYTNLGGQSWMRNWSEPAANVGPVFAMSEPLTVFALPTNTFADYMDDFPEVATETGFNDDPDRDQLANGLEAWFGTHPGQFDSGLAILATDSTTTTFSHPQNADPPSDVSAHYEWSGDLENFFGNGVSNGGTSVSFSAATDTPSPGITTVTATITGASPTRLFVRVGVTQSP